MDAITQSLFVGGKFPAGTIVCYHSNYPGDIIIRLGSGSYYSHVAVANGDGSATCAWQGGGGMQAGVIQNFADHMLMPQGVCDARLIPQAAEVLKEVKLQLGKPYDYTGWVADPLYNIFRIKMAGGPTDSFHCSSLVAWALQEAGVALPKKSLRGMTPQDIWNVIANS